MPEVEKMGTGGGVRDSRVKTERGNESKIFNKKDKVDDDGG